MTSIPTSTTSADTEVADRRSISRGRWITAWRPEDETFWAETGRTVACRNLVFSILTEHIGFAVWSVWSVLVLFMGPK